MRKSHLTEAQKIGLTNEAEALIASVYLAGTNARRVKRALYGCSRVRQERSSSAAPGAR